MTNIYLVRHAQSVANTQDIYQGQSYNTPLSGLGIRQAQALADSCKNLGATRIIASPLQRTHETSMIISKRTNLPVLPSLDLLETNHGQWEGKSVSLIKEFWPDMWLAWKTKPSTVHFPSGESFLDVQARVVRFWQSLSQNDPIILVTHENIIQIILTHVLNDSLDNIWNYPVPNASITTIQISDTNAKILALPDASHLSGVK
jgi:probable phosphoglycerate mutase